MIDWTAVSDLGKVPDRVIAERLGVSINCVSENRWKRGIKPLYQKHIKKGVDWSRANLGEDKDSVIAARNGVLESVVRTARIRRGIPASIPKLNIDWTTIPLGLASDSLLGILLGVSRAAVRAARVLAGIARWPGGNLSVELRDRIWPMVDWSRFPLGEVPDLALSRRTGIPSAWFKKARLEKGISPSVHPRLEAATPRNSCECGRTKKLFEVACDRCTQLDNLDVAGVAGSIMSELRMMGASTMTQICRALGWESSDVTNPGNGSISRQLKALIESGRVRKFTTEDGEVLYVTSADVGRGCYDSSCE